MMATEKRLIDAIALIESGYDVTLDEVFPDWEELPDSTKEAVCKHGQYLKKLINDQPTVDAVEVIRCKDCKDHDKCEVEGLLRYFDPTSEPYCSVGERKDNVL